MFVEGMFHLCEMVVVCCGVCCFTVERSCLLRWFCNVVSVCMCSLGRLSYLQNLLQSLLQAEDVIKVHEARLTEKETTSLDLNEVERYRSTLKVR